jgi:hypothetical protein
LVPLQDGVSFGGVQVFRGGTAFQRPKPLVLIDRHHHGGLTAKVYEVVLVAVLSRLGAHDSILEKAVTFGTNIDRRGARVALR